MCNMFLRLIKNKFWICIILFVCFMNGRSALNITHDGIETGLQFSEGGSKNTNNLSTPERENSASSNQSSTTAVNFLKKETQSHLDDDDNYKYFDNSSFDNSNLNYGSSNSSIKARKGVENIFRIVGRKGVDVFKPVVDDGNLSDSYSNINTACHCCSTVHHLLNCSECLQNNSVINDYCQICKSHDLCKYICCDSGNVTETKNSSSVTEIISKQVKKKLKPLITEVSDEAISYVVLTNNIETSYLVPILICFLIIPFIVIIFLFLFKKSKELWDKRNYKRMDFLIDGIYND